MNTQFVPGKYLIASLLLIISVHASAQCLRIKHRSEHSQKGSAFAAAISDSTLSLAEREKIIFHEIQNGNLPDFYRKLCLIADTVVIRQKEYMIKFYVLPDYLAIGSTDDYFYCPMTPSLAQRVADLFQCSLPTRKISDLIYQHASQKLRPLPIPPSKAMTTVRVFIRHNEMIKNQRDSLPMQFPPGTLVAGNKKDIVISNTMFTTDGKDHVVIYGWQKPGGIAIQPLYNGHTGEWADYSHGVRLIQNKVWVNNKRTTIQKVLQSAELNSLLSDEGQILLLTYPIR